MVRNKPSRVKDVTGQLKQVTEEGHCPQPLATALRGRLQYAEDQLYGRAAAFMMPSFRARASGKDKASMSGRSGSLPTPGFVCFWYGTRSRLC